MSSFGEEPDDAANGKRETGALSDFGIEQPALEKAHLDGDDKPGSLIKCEECGIMCAGKSHYDVHIRSHTGERPYICKICGFGFTQKGNLRRHMKIHSDEKPFECSVCSYKCRRRDALNGHMRIHSDHRPFRCKYCDRSYKSRQSMKEHELACSFKVGKPLYDSLRERTSSLDFPDQSPLQSSANLQRRTPVIPFQPPNSLLNNLPFGNLPSFAASNHLNQIMMYQNLFPQQLAARFRSLAENSIQNKREKSQIPVPYPPASVTSSVKSNIKSDDGHEDNPEVSLHTTRRLLSDSSLSVERKIPSSGDSCIMQDQVITELRSSRKRAREPSREPSEHETELKRSKQSSDEDNEEIIVDDGNTDSHSSSEHESVYDQTTTHSEAHHESPEHEADKKDEDLTVYVKGKRTVIYSCHICDCFFLKKSAHSIHMGAHMGSMMNLHSSLQLGHQNLITGKLSAGIH